MAAINKKKWFIGIMGVAVLISAILFWFFFVIPNLFKLQKDFTYEAEVLSSDNFYNEAKGEFSGASISATKFSYSVIGEQNGVLTIKNTFDVHKLTGEPIFSVERLYGIDPITGKHVAGFGDKNRDGYLFAPKGLKKGEPFTYWHINYDGPAHMQFAGEETINGLTVYRYETHYEGVNIDQTKNLGFLPEVGVTRGINLDPYLQLWIEPQTGTLINYKDETTAYYYDLKTGKRLYPWNKFSNTFKHSSIITQVEIAKQKKLFIFVINLGVLIAIILIAFITILVWSLRHLYTAKKDVAKNLKKLEGNQIKLKEEQVKSKDTATIVSLQNEQLEKTKKATLNVLDDLKSEEKILKDAQLASQNILEDLNIEKSKVEIARAKEEAILLSIGDGLIATDEKGIITFINKTAEKLLGKKSEEVMGKSFFEVIVIEDEKGVSIPFQKRPVSMALAGGTTTTTTGPTYYYVRPDKTKFPVAIMVTPIILDGKIIGTIEIFRDITREKEIDRAKSEFVSLASHQLKTPPTAVKLLTERLLGGKTGTLTEKQKEYLNDIHSENQRSIELVNALLNVSRIEMGAFTIQLNKKNVCTVVQSVLYELKSIINRKQLRLEEVYQNKSIAIPIDEALFRMVVNNLVMNAVNYTAEGGTIHVEYKEVNKGQTLGGKFLGENSFVTVVSDTGYGIPKNQQNKLFTKFFRADNAREKHTDGTGLGLYIVKSILDNSGGSIWFTSEENKGTTFYVAIPMTGMKARTGKKGLVDI